MPTVDVYSDIFLINKLFTGVSIGIKKYCGDGTEGCTELKTYPSFGGAMLAPVLLCWLFVARQWYRMERGWRQKLVTLPLLMLQVYPQWLALKVLYHAWWKRSPEWPKMRYEWESEISHLGTCI